MTGNTTGILTIKDQILPGYCGFTYHPDAFISRGIAYFERWERSEAPIEARVIVSHAFIVGNGPDEVIEAEAKGVVRATLSQYSLDPKCNLYFRRPRGYTSLMGATIVTAAEAQIGDRYDFLGIAARAGADSVLGHLANNLLKQAPDNLVTRLLTSQHRLFCSAMDAVALNAVPSLAGKGCLAKPAREIDPQRLFEDQILFE